jgi:hypothetical protein
VSSVTGLSSGIGDSSISTLWELMLGYVVL